MYLFSNVTQKHIIVAQQLIGTRRTSSQDMVSTVVVLSHLIPSISPSSVPCAAWDAFPSQKPPCDVLCEHLKRAQYQIRIQFYFRW